ncbi:MAG: protein tyrosine phosphatase [Alphaproteobacteria bacterium]
MAKARKFDLSSPWGRLAAHVDMTWRDHAFLRVWWTNAHWISDEMVRSNQPWPFQIRAWGRRGIKTFINLRGPGKQGQAEAFLQLERDACARAGIRHVDFTLNSRATPSAETLREAQALFNSIDYPALMHCKSGADRAGIASVLYLHFRKGEPIDRAMRMLGLRYGHVKQGKTGVLDHFFESYLAHSRVSGLSLIEWAEKHYDPEVLKADFQKKSKWWANILVDKILNRE